MYEYEPLSYMHVVMETTIEGMAGNYCPIETIIKYRSEENFVCYQLCCTCSAGTGHNGPEDLGSGERGPKDLGTQDPGNQMHCACMYGSLEPR